MSAILILWLVSCTTTRINNPAPKSRPPEPYDANGNRLFHVIYKGETFTAPEDCVYMPYWYFEKLYDYIVDTQAAQEIAAGNKKTPEK